MEEKKSKNAIIIILLFTIIAVAAMGVYIYILTGEKEDALKKNSELQTQVNSLNVDLVKMQEKIDTISKTINDGASNTNSNSTEFTNTTNNSSKNYEDIILDGHYGIPNSDGGWDFTKDGRTASGSNVSVMQGTYKTTGKNTIEAHYTKSKLWEENSEVVFSDIDKYETITVDNDNNLYWTNPNGEKVKLQRYGDVVEGNLE